MAPYREPAIVARHGESEMHSSVEPIVTAAAVALGGIRVWVGVVVGESLRAEWWFALSLLAAGASRVGRFVLRFARSLVRRHRISPGGRPLAGRCAAWQ